MTGTVWRWFKRGLVWLGKDDSGACLTEVLRVIEPEETIPKGTVTRWIDARGMGTQKTNLHEFDNCDYGIRVLVSAPTPEPSEAEQLREVITSLRSELDSASTRLEALEGAER